MMKIVPVILLVLVMSNCMDDSVDSRICNEGLIIGKIRSGGGGLAVSVTDPGLSTHSWNGFTNVVEALNIPENFSQPGQKIYFLSRPPTESERSYIITADGDESDKPLIYLITASTEKCPLD